jgi:hypothetical protein
VTSAAEARGKGGTGLGSPQSGFQLHGAHLAVAHQNRLDDCPTEAYSEWFEDPYAAKPTASNHWIKTGPHIMIVGADAGFYDTYPKGVDPDTRSPYVMWTGTPYQHLMAPIR